MVISSRSVRIHIHEPDRTAPLAKDLEEVRGSRELLHERLVQVVEERLETDREAPAN
ncbi:hypothetical protein ACIBMX_47110 [Streptomyces phaeochromogenes]|uniref:hypothetical protein n=1 Tax=Streptomyces phaeochromogenes TaxID=1923 RepID=UPI0033D9CE06